MSLTNIMITEQKAKTQTELEAELEAAYELIGKMEGHLACPTCYAAVSLVRDSKGKPVKFFCPTCIWEEEI